LTPTEEVAAMLKSVKKYLAQGDVEDTWMPWSELKDTDLRIANREIRVKTFEDLIGVLPNGDLLPLTCRQRLLFRTPTAKLVFKAGKVHKKCKDIVKEINELRTTDVDEKDAKLIKHFILECVSPFKRHALKKNNAAFNMNMGDKPSWPVYIASWSFISGALCFFMYWIFAWGIYNGDSILQAWGTIYGTSAGKDIFLVQITRTVLLFYLPAQAMQPQLMRIRSVLADISMNCLNYESEWGSSADESVINVVQHMSAVCRASRSIELRDLPASWLMRQVSKTLHALCTTMCGLLQRLE
jgi:hypothetical protein